MRFVIFLCALCCGFGQSVDLVWKLPLGKSPAGPPVVFSGGAAVALADGSIVLVDESGKISATARMDQAPMGPPLVADGAIYAADAWGSVYKFWLTGERVWKNARESRAGTGYNTPILARVAGESCVVITDTRGHLYAIDRNGKLRMEIAATSYRLSTPAVGDAIEGWRDLVFGADDGNVYTVSEWGELRSKTPLNGARLGRAVPLIADVDDDGNYETYMPTPFVGRQTGLHSIGRWHFKTEMQTYASLMLADLDGDGKREILVGDKNTRLYAMNARGEKMWSTQLGGRGIFYAGVVAGDWIYQIVRDAGLDGKSLYVLDKRGNIRTSVAMEGGGGFSPALQRGRLLAVSARGVLHCYRIPEGPVQWGSWRNSSDNSGLVVSPKFRHVAHDGTAPGPGERRVARRGTNVLPGAAPKSFHVKRPDGSIFVAIGSSSFGVDAPGEYWVYRDTDRKPVIYVAGEESLPLWAPATEFGDAVAERLRAAWAFAMKHPSVARFDAVRAQAREAEELFAAKPAGDVLVRQLANTWGSERVYRDGFGVKMLGNEYESIAFTVTNLRVEKGQFRVECSAKYVDIREVPLVRPESTGRLTEDVLPRLNEAGTVTLEPGETRKLWAIVHSRDLAAGRHTAVLRVGDMWSLAKPVDVPIRVEVSAARLPEKRTYQQCNWLYLASISDARAREATIVDALEHGMTVFPIPALSFPLEGKPDSGMHDAIVTRLKGKATFLVSGSVGGPLAEKDYAAAVRKYSEHMLALGLRFDDWAFYFMDEPGLMGKDAAFDKYVADITRLKQADPRVRIYANPAGGAKPEMMAPLTKLIDIWQPDLHLVREQPEAYARVFQQGKYWHYEAGADQRNLDTLGYYRMKPWVAFQMGMTGGGYWVYSYSPFWYFDQAMGTEYGTVYQTPQGPVTTKRWEGSRDGAEDFELLWQVRERARLTGNKAATKLVEEAVAFVTAGQEKASDIGRQVEPFAPDHDRWMRYRADLVAAWEKML